MVPPVCEVGPVTDLEAVAPCWWTRALVESTDSRQSICPLASACTCYAVSTLSQVPSVENRWWRFQTVCQGPNSAGRSRQAMPVR